MRAEESARRRNRRRGRTAAFVRSPLLDQVVVPALAEAERAFSARALAEADVERAGAFRRGLAARRKAVSASINRGVMRSERVAPLYAY